ncbi:MAG TPA: hypothetical protein VF193_12885 [Steroidobacter sp.]
MKKRVTVSTVLSCTVAAILSAGAASADVTIEERMSLSGAGMMKMMNMTGTTVTTIAGDRARTETNMRFESGLMRTFARGAGQSVEIVRLDQDKIYMLDPNNKTYTETTFAAQRAQMERAIEQMQQGQASQQQAASGVDESQCEWSEPKAEVKRSGETATIGGYKAERITVTATQSCKDKKTGQVCDFGIALDQWIAPDFEAAEDTLAYQRMYAEKLGLDAAGSRNFVERAESMFGRYEGIWSEIATHMKDLNGYPVKSTFGLGVGGPQCQTAQQAETSEESAPPPTSITGAIGGALGGLLKRKKAEQPAQQDEASSLLPGGLIPLMTLSNELVSMRQDKAEASLFEVPPDYKKATD